MDLGGGGGSGKMSRRIAKFGSQITRSEEAHRERRSTFGWGPVNPTITCQEEPWNNSLGLGNALPLISGEPTQRLVCCMLLHMIPLAARWLNGKRIDGKYRCLRASNTSTRTILTSPRGKWSLASPSAARRMTRTRSLGDTATSQPEPRAQ